MPANINMEATGYLGYVCLPQMSFTGKDDAYTIPCRKKVTNQCSYMDPQV